MRMRKEVRKRKSMRMRKEVRERLSMRMRKEARKMVSIFCRQTESVYVCLCCVCVCECVHGACLREREKRKPSQTDLQADLQIGSGKNTQIRTDRQTEVLPCLLGRP